MTESEGSAGFSPKQHEWTGEIGRSPYIPNWYGESTFNGDHQPRHVDPALRVTYKGKPLGYAVGDVLVERRWAIDQYGELMSNEEFEGFFVRYLSGFETPGGFEPRFEHIPHVKEWVGKKYDHQGNMIDITFDEFKDEETAVLKDTKIERMEYLAQLHEDGQISDEAFASEVSKLAGKQKQEEVEEHFVALCGKNFEIESKQKAHERRCGACAEARKTSKLEEEIEA